MNSFLISFYVTSSCAALVVSLKPNNKENFAQPQTCYFVFYESVPLITVFAGSVRT